ncbi:hypothetical protein P4V47_23135 [Brevibacillus laterosporus]|uniref:hypothetical protein n=1 Tax=Brevibacillus laterosporus TaxID=1465 RepID=UPI002E23950C|nr:hypothetical protein [Brevibacillus laterosporus]
MRKISMLLMVFAFLIASIGVAGAVNTGWQTKNGVEARVYTDRSGDYPESDSYVKVTGEKKGSGTLYYRLELIKHQDGREIGIYSEKGTMTSSASATFYKDNFLSKGSSGTYSVMLKLFKDRNEDEWIGDWISSTFKVNN